MYNKIGSNSNYSTKLCTMHTYKHIELQYLRLQLLNFPSLPVVKSFIYWVLIFQRINSEHQLYCCKIALSVDTFSDCFEACFTLPTTLHSLSSQTRFAHLQYHKLRSNFRNFFLGFHFLGIVYFFTFNFDK